MALAQRRLLDHLEAASMVAADPPFGLFCDLDGTISPIVADPMAARATEVARRSLSAIKRGGAYVAIVSGRGARVARAMVGLRGITYVGIHGLEWYEQGRLHHVPGLGRAQRAVARLNKLLAPRLERLGITVETKDVAIAFHVRRAPDPEAARQALDAALSERPEVVDLVRLEGRQVVELRAKAAETKGTAVRRLAEAHRLRSLCYLGDDRTDVFAFEAVRELRKEGTKGLAIAVIDDETAPEVAEAADYLLAGVPEVERFLEWVAGELNLVRDKMRA